MRLPFLLAIAVFVAVPVARADDVDVTTPTPAPTLATPSTASANVTVRTHPEWGVFTSGALTVGVAYTISIVFAGLGDYYGYSGFLAIPLVGGFVYASFDELHPEGRWRGALLSASQSLGLVVWIVGMLLDVSDVSPGDTAQLAPGPGDLGLALTFTL